jgi:hypothetical protein
MLVDVISSVNTQELGIAMFIGRKCLVEQTPVQEAMVVRLPVAETLVQLVSATLSTGFLICFANIDLITDVM